MKLVYPACFYKEEDGGYSVDFPDLLGCCTQGESIEDAIMQAEDAALGWLLTALEDGEDLPKSTNINDVKLDRKNGFVSLLLLDLGAYSLKYGNRKSVKKTLTIPMWLNEKAERLEINFSKTLQDALLSKIIRLQK